jgi:hypothetical protein
MFVIGDNFRVGFSVFHVTQPVILVRVTGIHASRAQRMTITTMTAETRSHMFFRPATSNARKNFQPRMNADERGFLHLSASRVASAIRQNEYRSGSSEIRVHRRSSAVEKSLLPFLGSRHGCGRFPRGARPAQVRA